MASTAAPSGILHAAVAAVLRGPWKPAVAPIPPAPARPTMAEADAAWEAKRALEAYLDGHGQDHRPRPYGAGPGWTA